MATAQGPQPERRTPEERLLWDDLKAARARHQQAFQEEQEAMAEFEMAFADQTLMQHFDELRSNMTAKMQAAAEANKAISAAWEALSKYYQRHPGA